MFLFGYYRAIGCPHERTSNVAHNSPKTLGLRLEWESNRVYSKPSWLSDYRFRMDIDELTIKVLSSFGLQKAVCDQGFSRWRQTYGFLRPRLKKVMYVCPFWKLSLTGLYLLIVIFSASELTPVSCVSHKPSKFKLVLSSERVVPSSFVHDGFFLFKHRLFSLIN